MSSQLHEELQEILLHNISRNLTLLGQTLPALTPDLSKGLIPVAFFGALSFAAATSLFLLLTYRMIRWNLRARNINQFVILIWNLLLADIQQSMAFLLNAKWLVENRIHVESTTCWAQGWFISTGDLASGVWSFAIGVHTFAVVIFDYRLSNTNFIIGVFMMWTFIYLMAVIGVALHPSDFYVRAVAWCWVNTKYGALRLWLHYFWIFLFEFGTVLIYTMLILALRWRIQSNFYQGYRRTKHAKDAAKLMVAYPIIYVVCTLPLATMRMYSESRKQNVGEKWFCFAGAMITSNGWLDVLLYCLTRRVALMGDDPPDDNGIETFRVAWQTDVFGNETRCEGPASGFPSQRVSLEEPMVLVERKEYKSSESSDNPQGKINIETHQAVEITSAPMTAAQRRAAEASYQNPSRRPSAAWQQDRDSDARSNGTKRSRMSISSADYEMDGLEFKTKPSGF